MRAFARSLAPDRPVALESFTCWTHGGAVSAALLAYEMSIDVQATHLTLSPYICEEGERSSAARLRARESALAAATSVC